MTEQLQLLTEPRSRRVDASTSLLAATRVAPGTSALEEAIVTAVADALAAVTADEIADRVLVDHPARWGRSTVLTAVSRARRRGRIVPAGQGVTSRGSTAVAYTAAK